MQQLSLTVSLKQLQQSVFYRLKCYASNSKLKKRSLKVRMYMKLKKHYDHSRNVKAMDNFTKNVMLR